ncbi:MAG: tetratricopeptide repeat protein [Bacteroidaceae bacterium]|nr:tetratricopeptide repeat protein [Bacteroidaceae bacterium]
MLKRFTTYATALLAIITAATTVGCSSSKNTAQMRFYKSFTARYNTYFNGHEAFKEAVEQQEKENKDNFMEVLPYYIVSNKETAEIGKGSYDRTILKCEKTIRLHSIKAKPKVAPEKKKTEKNRKWLAQKEYNPFLWKAWILMGQAQFNKGEFIEAASTFSYISRLYSNNPDVLALSRIWLARCYSELDWFYDSEDILNNVNRDSLSWKLTSSYAGARGHLLLRQQKYKEAIPYIEKSLKSVKGAYNRARMFYLLGQICHQTGDEAKAYKYFSNVIGLNPPYIIEFNARIMQTEVMSKANSYKVLKKLNSMARNPKNSEYLDQVHYAIGNVYLAKGDTARAIKSYEEGRKANSRNGIEKGILNLKLGNIYWERHKYKNAKECYTDALGLIGTTHAEYKETNRRSEILDELVEHSENIELQDSLQRLAKMPEAERLACIDRIIEEVIKKEKEEEKAAEREARQAEHDATMAELESKTQTEAPTTPIAKTGDNAWYFYNPNVVAQGKTAFQKRWGRRPLEDNWRRKNKGVLQSEEPETAVAQADEEPKQTEEELVRPVSNPTKGLKEMPAEAAATDDNKSREFYLKQIPLTEEKMAESNDILKDALYGEGVVYQDRLEDFAQAKSTFLRLINNFPKYEKEEEVYYRLYLMDIMQNGGQTSAYRQKLKDEYPEGDYTKMANDPEYLYNAKYGKHIEDSLYAATYEAYRNGDYDTVEKNVKISAEKYPKGRNRAKFMFVEAMDLLHNNNQDGFVEKLKEIAQRFSNDGISEIAGLMIKGVMDGRILQNTSLTGSLWSRRSKTTAEEEKEAGKIPEWNKNEEGTHLFMLAYENGKVNENQLLFEIARYNFSKFMVRNFDLSFVRNNGIGMLQVKPFINMKEAIRYSQQLFAADEMRDKLAGLRVVIISEENMKLLGEYYSFDDYQEYFEKTYHNQLPKIMKEIDSIDSLNEPDYDVPEKKEETVDSPEQQGGTTDDDNFNPFNF